MNHKEINNNEALTNDVLIIFITTASHYTNNIKWKHATTFTLTLNKNVVSIVAVGLGVIMEEECDYVGASG